MNFRLSIYAGMALVLLIAWVAAFVIWRAAEMGDLIAPLDQRAFEELTVVAVGTGNEFENSTRLGPSAAVALGESLYLVDAGRGIAEALRYADIPVDQPDTVLLTSLLPEATVGLDDLWLTGWRRGRDHPLRVIGPAGTAGLVAGLLGAHAGAVDALERGLGLPSEGAIIEVTEVGEGWSEQRGDLKVTAHDIAGGPALALGWRFESLAGLRRTVAITGTGWSNDELVRIAKDADLWMHESIYIPTPEEAEAAGVIIDPDLLERDAAMHAAMSEAGELATRAGVGHLVFWRLRPPPMYDFQITGFVSQSFDGKISVPADGAELSP